MALPALKQDRYTYEEYLEIEAGSDERHIFWDGEIFNMSGGSSTHVQLETNLIVLLGAALKGQPCRPRVGNQRIRALAGERAVYADATVFCGQYRPHPQDPGAMTNPTVVFEVLSKSTEAFDRGDKFAFYRTIPELRSFVLLSQKARRIERYYRDERGVWSLEELGPDDALTLPELGVSIPLSEIYEGTDELTGDP